jgi:hypothetical protein
MVKSKSKKNEKTCKIGEDDDECSTIIGGYVVRNLEAPIW